MLFYRLLHIDTLVLGDQVCLDSECCLEALLKAMADNERKLKEPLLSACPDEDACMCLCAYFVHTCMLSVKVLIIFIYQAPFLIINMIKLINN